MISIGDELDSKYLVLSRLGSGGFGEVFLAGDKLIPGRKVALKVLSKRSAGDHDDLIWEMQALSQFNHPGVVGFHHHFTHDNPPSSQSVRDRIIEAGSQAGRRTDESNPGLSQGDSSLRLKSSATGPKVQSIVDGLYGRKAADSPNGTKNL